MKKIALLISALGAACSLYAVEPEAVPKPTAALASPEPSGGPFYSDESLSPEARALSWQMQEAGFRLRFDEARKLAQDLEKASEGHPLGRMLELSVRYLEIEELALAKKNFRKESDEFIELAQRLAKVSESQLKLHPKAPWARTYLGASYGGQGLVEMLRGNFFTAWRSGRKGAGYMQEAVDLPPGVVDAKYGLGQYKYYSGTYGPVLSFLLFLDGDIEGGLKQLEDCAARGTYTKLGASIFLAKVLILEQKAFERAEPHARLFFEKYPENHRAGRYLLECARGFGLKTPKGREMAELVFAHYDKGWRPPAYAPFPIEEVREELKLGSAPAKAPAQVAPAPEPLTPTAQTPLTPAAKAP